MNLLDVYSAQFYITLGLSVLNGVLMCFAAYKFFQMIQLSGYKLKGYFLWLKDTKAKYVSRLLLLTLLSLFCVLVTNALFDVYHSKALYSYLGLIFYFYFTIVFIVNLYQAPKKVPLKNTTRMTRLMMATFTFVAVLSFFLTVLSTEYTWFIKFGILCFTPIFIPIIVPVVHILLLPLEKLIVFYYVDKAKLKLKKHSNLIKIGITGSFGKTSTKYILNTILSEKYKVCMSPHSFNTLPGLSKVVNNYLTDDDEVLIAEMGARRKGDITELCNLIKPSIGVVTGVGSQHLLTFKNLENIYNTKFELIQSLPQNGYAVFNGENENCVKMFNQCSIEKDIVGEYEKSNIQAKNISFNENGTTFDLIINGKTYKCKTELLGKHNVLNILLCVSVAVKLGLTNNQIVSGIGKLKPVAHRLELIKTENNLILDDSYNASVEGVRVAIEVLNKLGSSKIVITPGLVELGEKEKEENENFGKELAKIANKVVIVNKVNFESIKKGLLSNGFSEDNIYQAETLDKAKILMKDFIKKGDVILFENDLPDNYI